jgi:ABC-2 type transport system permease protein
MLRSIFAKTLRDQRRPLMIWSAIVILVLIIGYKAFGQIDASQIASLVQNPAFRFLSDPVAVDTPAGFVTFRYGFVFSLALGIFAMIIGSRMVRGEEERGSLEMILATPHARCAVLREKALATIVGIAVVGLAFAIGNVLGAAGANDTVNAAPALLAGANLSLLLFFYAMLALFISQYTQTAAASSGITGGLYALFFIMDGTGRVSTGAAWVQYLSPNFYYGRSKPLITTYGTNPGAMALLLALGLLLLVVSAVIFAGRDIGAVEPFPIVAAWRSGRARVIPAAVQIDRAARDPWLRSVFMRSLRANGPALGCWALGVALYGAYGAGIAKSSEQQLRDVLKGSPALARLLGPNLLATDYGFLALIGYLLISIVVMLYALIRANTWPADQDNGRIDIILSTPQRRRNVALASYGAALVAFLLLAVAHVIGILAGAGATHLTLAAGRVAGASLAFVPPMAVIAGAVFLLGARLRSGVVAEIVGGYLGLAFFMDLLRTVLHLPTWIQHLSVFSAYGTPIVDGVSGIRVCVMLALAALFTGIGVALFQTADVRQGG